MAVVVEPTRTVASAARRRRVRRGPVCRHAPNRALPLLVGAVLTLPTATSRDDKNRAERRTTKRYNMKLTHKDIEPMLDRLAQEPEFKCGSTYKPTGQEWYRQAVWLEFPLGELAKDSLTTLALTGMVPPTIAKIEPCDRFNAQGLEGKARVRKQLFGALMAMRDLLPEHRGQIVI